VCCLAEQRRLEFERRKKEIAEQQPKVTKSRSRRPAKDGSAPGGVDGTDRVSKKRPKKPGLGASAVVGVVPSGAAVGLGGKASERSAADYSLMAEQVQQQLQQLPSVSLQEPEVRINYAVWPMLGSSVFSGECYVVVRCWLWLYVSAWCTLLLHGTEGARAICWHLQTHFLTALFHLRNDHLYCVGWGVKLYSLTHCLVGCGWEDYSCDVFHVKGGPLQRLD